MKQVNVKKLILPNIPYVFIALLATKVSEAVRLAPGSDASAETAEHYDRPEHGVSLPCPQLSSH